ncbi:hypothetical protein [Brevifollis gellanilyticus]|uniref:Uncharacterized protein n=1 Tax=Brevifollis gellanilyticus TaxID=748831 RepID=A0A512MAF4_9BACT|nr:hypothetical protein [Brevifollis gellanilyticus]GEP43714.1 hypothetical protein BGE01nite_30050 [Brevifollis gellanilyticus]
MNVSFNVSSGYASQIGQTDQTEKTQESQKSSKSLTVSVFGGKGSEETKSSNGITLSYPMIGPEDFDVNEFAQSLANMDVSVLQTMTNTAAALVVNGMVLDLASNIVKGGTDYIEKNAADITAALEHLEKRAAETEKSLFDMISSSKYPDFNSFLKLMLSMAQELRESTAKARQEMVKGEYNNMLDQAKTMMDNAKSNYDAAIKEAKATRAQGIGKIVGGCLTFATSLAGGLAGRGNPAMGFLAGAQAGGMFGNAMTQIIDGSTAVYAAEMQTEAAGHKKDAEEGQALLKKYEASQKLMQDAQQVIQEMRDAAKTLSDMVLKLYQDFIQNQSQIVSRANI